MPVMGAAPQYAPNRPPTVLHLRASNFVGGPERQVLRYATGGAAAGHGRYRQILATFTAAGSDHLSGEGQALLAAARAAGVEAWGLPGGGWRDLAALGELDRLVREQQVRLICSHGYRADLLAAWVGRRRRIPTAWFLRGWTGEDAKVRLYEAADRAALGWADRIVCLSESQAASLPARVARERVAIVVNAIPAPSGSAAWFGERREAARAELGRRFGFAGMGRRAPLVAIAGRLSPEKGAAVFLQAVAHAAQKLDQMDIGAQFLIFGHGPLQSELEARARGLGLEQRVRFAGFVAEWMRLLPGLDLLVNPSFSEQSPNVVLEAMAARVPVLATAVGAVAEMAGTASDGNPALELVAPGDAVALGERMLELLPDEGRRQRLAEAGWQRVRAAYSPEQQQAQLDRLYRELLGPVAPPAPVPPRADSVDHQIRLRQLGGALSASGRTLPTIEARTPSDHRGRPEQKVASHPAAQPAEAATAEGGDSSPRLSVVLPVRHEGRHLGALLEQLLEQDYPVDRYEIVIADGGEAGDRGTELAQAYASRFPERVRWIENPGRRSSAGRNAGLRAATGEWILFVDGHCRLPGRDWLRANVEALRRHGALCLSRPQPLTAETTGFWQRVIAAARASRLGHGADSTIYELGHGGWVPPDSSGAVYHCSLFARVGGYDEDFDACEDVELNHRLSRAGVTAWMAPEAVVFYAARTGLAGLWRQLARYGRGRVRLARKHPDACTLAQCLPALWLVWLPLALAGAGWGSGIVQAVSVSTLGLYGAALALAGAALVRREGLAVAAAAPFAWLTIHAALGAGWWREFLAGSKPALRVPRAAASAAQPESVSRSHS